MLALMEGSATDHAAWLDFVRWAWPLLNEKDRAETDEELGVEEFIYEKPYEDNTEGSRDDSE